MFTSLHSYFKNLKKPSLIVGLIATLTVLIILIVVFNLGMYVGYKQAMFSDNWGRNYEHNFILPPVPTVANLMHHDMRPGFGIFGQVLRENSDGLVIVGKDKIEQVVTIDDDVVIHSGDTLIKLTDIALNDKILVFGKPNDKGQIEAKFIRVFPSNLNETK